MIIPADIALLEMAAHAARYAHAPYSGFSVGAALQAEDGHVFCGCNVENASYGLTICAERSAVAAAVSAGATTFKRLAVVASGEQMPYPCGACRQVLAEFCDGALEVLVAPLDHLELYTTLSLESLLPHAFRLSQGARRETGAPGMLEGGGGIDEQHSAAPR